MNRRKGTGFVAAGIILLLIAGGIYGKTIIDAHNSYEKTSEIMEKIVDEGQTGTSGWEYESTTMRYVLSIPSLNLEIPIAKEYSEENLKMMPCEFTGSAEERNLVICGHNYREHFGRLSQISIGGKVCIADSDGTIFEYYVADIETINAYDVDSMINEDYDLSLFTCTFSGKARFTARCRRA